MFPGFPGILNIGRSSYIFSKLFRFSPSKVLEKVVNSACAYAIRRSISALAESNVTCA